MQSVVADKSALERTAGEATRTRRRDPSQERDAGRQVEVSACAGRSAQLEGEVQQLRSRRETAQALAQGLGPRQHRGARAAVRRDRGRPRGLDRARHGPEPGQGGPLQVAALDPEHGRPVLVMPADPMRNNIERLSSPCRGWRAPAARLAARPLRADQRLRQAPRSVHQGLGVPCRARLQRRLRIPRSWRPRRAGWSTPDPPGPTATWSRSITAWGS